MYFGNKNRMIDVPCPAINIDRGTGRWESAGTYLNGGAYQISSGYTHRRYGVSWNLMSADSVRRITDYYHNVFGDGLIYMLDPFIEKRNTLPLNWSVPVLGLFDAPPLVYDTLPTRQQAATVSYTNLLTNPSFRATSGVVEVWRNLLTNPSFEATSGTVEVRRNFFPNPRGAVSTGWPTAPANVTVAFGEPGALVTHTSGTPSGNAYIRTPLAGLTASTTYSLRYEVTEVAGTVALFGRVVDAFTTIQAVTVSKAGAQILITATFTTGTTVPSAPFLLVEFQGAGAGEQFRVVGGVCEVGTAVLPYFDHTFSPDTDLTPSATGTPNASPSILSGAGVAAVSGGSQRVIVSSTQWSASGSRSIRIIPTNWVAESAGANVYTFPAQDVGKTFTVMATARLAAPQTGTLSWVARKIILLGSDTSGPQAPNEAGEHQLRWTFTVNTTGQSLRLANGAAIGGGDIWWDKVVLVEGVYNGPAFDGSSSGDPDLSAAWAGTANASTSFVTAPGIVGASGALKIWKTSNGLKATVPGSPSAWRVGIAPSFPATNHTVLMRVRTTWTGYIRPSVGGPANGTGETLIPVVAGVWTTLRGLVIGGSNPAGVVGRAGDGYVLGDTVEVEYALVVAGDYAGPYFDGNTPNTLLNAYTWTGTPNASTTVLTAYPSVESGLPREAAQYTLTAESAPVEVFLPVPPGKVLHFGALGTKTGTAGVQLVTAMGAITNVLLLPVNSSQMTNTTVTESVTLRLTGIGTITLQALTARVLDPGEVSDYNNIFIPGEGNSGLRFTGVPAVSGYSSVMDKQALSAALVETGAWEPQ